MINLLPDTRLVKQRAHRRRQIVGTLATTICVVCGVVLLLLFLSVGSVTIIKNKLTDDIAAKKTKLVAVPGIIGALTAQQHLDSLPELYSSRTLMTKFFAAYAVANPTDVSLNALTVNPDNTMKATGIAGSYASVSKLARALEAEKDATGNKKFTTVEIESAGRESANVSFSLYIVMAPGVTSGN